MSEIEKLYANVGVEKEYEYVGHYPKTDENGIILPMVYPPFTAEKQLELIKWLAEFSDFGSFSPDVEINKDTKVKEYGFAFIKRGKRHYYIDTKFEIALAKCFNNLWQDLTEVERQQIKAILQ